MDMLQHDQLDIYFRLFREEPDAYSVFGMVEALLLTPIDIHWELLGHLQTLWDPLMRAYRIGDVFMCPTLEDFSGLLMSTGQTHAAMRAPSDSPSPFHYLTHYFDLNPESAASIIVHGFLDVQ